MIQVFWDVMTCRNVTDASSGSEKSAILSCSSISRTLTTKAANCFETSVPTCQSTWYHIPEYVNIRIDFGEA